MWASEELIVFATENTDRRTKRRQYLATVRSGERRVGSSPWQMGAIFVPPVPSCSCYAIRYVETAARHGAAAWRLGPQIMTGSLVHHVLGNREQLDPAWMMQVAAGPQVVPTRRCNPHLGHAVLKAC